MGVNTVAGEMNIARRLLDGIAIRFSGAEQRLNELRLVSAPPRSNDPIDFGAVTLHASQFTPEWLNELRIEPAVIFDVGAFHSGVAAFLRRSYPNATIFAFEADPAIFKIAAKNAEQFGITPVNVAVSDYDGVISWHGAANGGPQGSVFARFENISQTPGIQIPCSRLDSFCAERRITAIDVLHVDVEGAEYETLIGLGSIRPQVIFLEAMSRAMWVGAKSSGEVHRLLSRMGYCLAGDFRTDRLYVHHLVL
jgi:FkbM family methyltransferase